MLSSLPHLSPLVLLASARPAGNTSALIRTVFAEIEYTLLDVLETRIYPYSYEGQYPPDDGFLALIEQLLHHEAVVLATPVYWYAMSGPLKTFFDRLTDLVTVAKPLGRQLRSKGLFLLVTGSDKALPPGFEEPFKLTAQYFAMQFGGSFYQVADQVPAPSAIAAFAQAVRDFRATPTFPTP